MFQSHRQGGRYSIHVCLSCFSRTARRGRCTVGAFTCLGNLVQCQTSPAASVGCRLNTFTKILALQLTHQSTPELLMSTHSVCFL